MARKKTARNKPGKPGITITLKRLEEIKPSLSGLLNQHLSVDTAYRLGKLARVVNDEYQQLEENKIRLIQHYGKKYKDDIGNIRIPQDTIEYANYIQDYSELLKKEIVIASNQYEPIAISDLEGNKLSALDMVNLEPFIDMDELKKR